MARAVWKGPFVEESLMKKVDKYKDDPKKIPIKTWSRKSTILPDFVGQHGVRECEWGAERTGHACGHTLLP